jgi:hypothetical protein
VEDTTAVDGERRRRDLERWHAIRAELNRLYGGFQQPTNS